MINFDQFVFQIQNLYLYFKSLRLQDLLLFVFINNGYAYIILGE